MKADDQAYPTTEYVRGAFGAPGHHVGHGGMIIRQAYKKACALGIITNADLMTDLIAVATNLGESRAQSVAGFAAELADALIAEDQEFEKRTDDTPVKED